MYTNAYVFHFTTAEVIRLTNQTRLVIAIFNQHNANGKRYLLRDKDTLTGILNEAEVFINANIGKTHAGKPTVWKHFKKKEIAYPVFSPDLTSIYRLQRAREALQHIYSQLTKAGQDAKVSVKLMNTATNQPETFEGTITDIYIRVDAVLCALKDNLSFWMNNP